MAIAQRGVRRVRFMVAVLIMCQYALDPSRFDVLDRSGGRLPMMLVSVGLLLGTNLASVAVPPSIVKRRTLPAIELALDTLLVVLLTTLTGTSGVGWVLFALPVIEADVMRAKDVVLAMPKLSARDALHVAVMERAGVTKIMSFDVGFDQVPGLTRLGA